MNVIMKKNDLVKLHIEDISAEGMGVGRVDGMVVFVPYGAIGDFLQALIVKVNKNHAYAKIREILTSSADRVENDCPVFGKCGGCAYRHISYDAELLAKRAVADAALRRIGGVDARLDMIIPSPQISNYRNKAVLPFGGGGGDMRLGFYAERSHRFVSIENCPLCPRIFGEIQKYILDMLNDGGISAYDEGTGRGLMRHLYLRRGRDSLSVAFVINGKHIPGEETMAAALLQKFPEITGILVNPHSKPGNVVIGDKFRLLYGDGHIRDEFCGLDMRIHPRSFYQVNAPAAELLYQNALSMAELMPGERVLDLYCGTGAIGLFFAKKRHDISVTGVEIEERAVADALENAKANNLANISFTRADLSSAPATAGYTTIVVDPPRRGLDAATAAALNAAGARQIIYISCNPATLARDIRLIPAYAPAAVRAVDLFPRTKHVELVALLRQISHQV